MKPVVPPVDREALKAELNEKTFLRKTNRAGNELYVVGPESVSVLREIGRLREIAFRNDGGGTGKELDIDEFDTNPAYGYRQLVLWDPDAQEIIGGYRFCLHKLPHLRRSMHHELLWDRNTALQKFLPPSERHRTQS